MRLLPSHNAIIRQKGSLVSALFYLNSFSCAGLHDRDSSILATMAKVAHVLPHLVRQIPRHELHVGVAGGLAPHEGHVGL